MAESLFEAVQRVLRGFAGTSRQQFVQQALECLGRAAGVDRAYVFENEQLPDGSLAASQRFEWCAPGVSPTLDEPELQQVPYRAAGMGRWLELFEQGRPVAGFVEEFPESERPLLEPQGIVSLAVVPIHVDGDLWGFVGFDAVRTRTEWTSDMLSALLAAASAIGHQESRVRAEGELVASRQRFERAVRGAQEGIYDWDLQRDEAWYSPAFAELLGIERDALGRGWDNWRSRIHPEDRARVDRALAAHLESGVPYAQTYRVERGDGTWRWVEDKGGVERAADGTPLRMSGAVMDITERRRLEDMFYQSQRLEAVGRLAGGVAHDFNNMLSVIMGYAEVLLRRLDDQDDKKRCVREIAAAAERSAQITRQLLTFARKQVVQPADVDVHRLIHGMRGVVESLLGESSQLVLEVSRAAGNTVRVDVGQFEQVLANLAANARDAMPRGGTLTVEAAPVVLDQEYARTHAGVEPGRYVCISVSDTGEGMDRETLQHIFEPFFTTKPRGRGTGLGLASVTGIVQRAGGFLRVYSEPGQGTTFKIYLPVVDGEASTVVVDGAPAGDVRGDETVLVVEDQPELRAMMKDALEQAGYRALAVGSVAEAREAMAGAGQLHLVVTDVVLPDGTGADVASAARDAHHGAKLLFTSGYTENVVVERGVMKPGIAFLSKPLTPSQLTRKVRTVLDTPSVP